VTTQREPASGSLIEILDRVLDKGVVVDATVRISLVGIEVLGIDARMVVASFETYLTHADAIAYTALAARSVQPPAAELLASPAAQPPAIAAEPADAGTGMDARGAGGADPIVEPQ
jgi:gas vesicle structural protein